MDTHLVNDLHGAVAREAANQTPDMLRVRRDLHEHPELSFQEHRTAAAIATELARLGIPAQTGVGQTGLVGTIQGSRPGPTLLIRGDMDALPITEQTGLDFASRNNGVMHACGHDIHSATLLGVAGILKTLQPSLAGTVRLMFQPAEEILGGARAMIADGVLEGVDMALGYHNHPDLPVGELGLVHGATYAACDRFRLHVHGKSGHAAYPHTTIDPIHAAAQILVALQSVVSREIDPLAPCVVTVGAIHAGTVHNIIPDTCEMLGTVRTLTAEARAQAEAAIRRHCAGAEITLRVRCELEWIPGVPPTMNDPQILARGVAAIERQRGQTVREGVSSMGAEDFAEIAARVPSFVLRIGSGAPGRADHLHNSDYQPDEGCLRIGAEALASAAFALMGSRA